MQAKHKKSLAVGTLVSLGVAGFLLWLAAPEMSYYSTPSKIVTGDTAPGEMIRVGGTVKQGSLQALTAGGPAALILTDGATDLKVELLVALPVMLREGEEAVAEGRLVNGVLKASRVFPRFDDPLKQPR